MLRKACALLAAGLAFAVTACSVDRTSSVENAFVPTQSRITSNIVPAGSIPGVYVANWGGESLLGFSGQGGNNPPFLTVTDATEGKYLGGPTTIGLDSKGRMYTAGFTECAYSIERYPNGYSGSGAPSSIMTSPVLYWIQALTLDTSDNVWVTQYHWTVIGGAATTCSTVGPQIEEFAAGSSGSVSPMRTIAGSNTKLAAPAGIAVGPEGAIFVSDNTAQSVLVFDSVANGNATPIRQIHGSLTGLTSPGAIAQDRSGYGGGRILVVNGSSILIFAGTATGNVAPIAKITNSTNGAPNWYPAGVATDSAGNIYVTSNQNPGSTIWVYPPGANGNATPSYTITASALLEPVGIAICDNEGALHVGCLYTNT